MAGYFCKEVLGRCLGICCAWTSLGYKALYRRREKKNPLENWLCRLLYLICGSRKIEYLFISRHFFKLVSLCLDDTINLKSRISSSVILFAFAFLEFPGRFPPLPNDKLPIALPSSLIEFPSFSSSFRFLPFPCCNGILTSHFWYREAHEAPPQVYIVPESSST